MEIVYVGDRNPRNRALLISNKEWKRLGKILTKKKDDKDMVEATKRLKEMRRETSKKMVDGWDNTELNITKKLLEQKQKAIAKLESERQQRDEEMKREALEVREGVIEKARKLKFEERDAVKTFNRALQHSEVLKERAIQMKFNEVKIKKKMEKDLKMAQEQNQEAEQYINDRTNEKQKNNELKRAKAEILLKELKDREDMRYNEKIALYESGKAELQKIANEIDEINEKANTEARAAKEKLQKDIADNQKLIARNNETIRLEEREEEMVTAIMAETKKILARARRLKERELTEVKRLALEEARTRVAAWPIKANGWAESDVRKAVRAEEQRYIDAQREKRELSKKRTEYFDCGNKLWKEEMVERQKRLSEDRVLEAERLEREKELLVKYAKLCCSRRAEKAEDFRKQLDKQCKDKAEMLLAQKKIDIDRHETFERQWHKEDEEFIEYTRNRIEENKQLGNPIVPLLKTVKDYLKKNNLCLDQGNMVMKISPKGPVYTSRIIRQKY